MKFETIEGPEAEQTFSVKTLLAADGKPFTELTVRGAVALHMDPLMVLRIGAQLTTAYRAMTDGVEHNCDDVSALDTVRQQWLCGQAASLNVLLGALNGDNLDIVRQEWLASQAAGLNVLLVALEAAARGQTPCQ